MQAPHRLPSPSIDSRLQALPKCNLHSHLEGSVRPSTLWDLAEVQGSDLGISRTAVRTKLQIDENDRSLVDYLRKISFAYPFLKDSHALRRVAFEAAEDQAADGVSYFELRAGPVTHSTPDLTVELVIESILAGLREAEDRYGITCRLIVSALRDHDPKVNVRLARIASDFRADGVIGFDLAGDEAGYPGSLHLEAFRVADAAGLRLTAHAGEAGGPENVRYAVETLGATRIGHGVRSTQSESVVNMLLQRNITLEICPVSNVHTGAVPNLDAHPVRRLYNAGVSVSIGDDDPVTSRTSVSRELALLEDHFDFTRDEIGRLQVMGLEAAFLNDETTRRKLIETFRSHWEEAVQ